MVFGIVLFALSMLVVIASGFYLVKKSVENTKTLIKVDYIKFIKKHSVISAGFAVFFTIAMFAIYLWAGIKPTVRDVLSTLFGGLLFSYLAITCLQLFIVHYYAKNVPENIDKWFFRSLCIAFPLMFVFIFLFSDGFADYLNLTQPLVNGFNFEQFKWSRPGAYGPSTNIAFYAICILSGAIYVYFLCDHKFYLKYGKHGILESTLFIALPAGIIGARLWYVIGNWNVEFATQDNPFLAALDMTKGGLTILGGAIMGIAAGVIWVLIRWKNKPYSVMYAMDIVVPTILIAQAVGRWGNFFNCEVHGFAVDEAYWRWLPKIIFNNAHFSSSYSMPLEGQIYVPLFLIEGIVNFLGFFVIAHLFGIKLNKILEPMDRAFMYVSWYGMTRVILEPFRDANFNMGDDGYWSWVWSMIFVLAGILLIVGNHVARYVYRKIKKENNAENTMKRGIGSGIAFAILGLPLIISGAIMMGNSTFSSRLVFDNFNIGLILLICGISAVLLIVISVLDIIKGINYKKINQQEEVA